VIEIDGTPIVTMTQYQEGVSNTYIVAHIQLEQFQALIAHLNYLHMRLERIERLLSEREEASRC